MGGTRQWGKWWLAALVLAVPLLPTPVAHAQPANPVLTVPEIRACVCQEKGGA